MREKLERFRTGCVELKSFIDTLSVDVHYIDKNGIIDKRNQGMNQFISICKVKGAYAVSIYFFDRLHFHSCSPNSACVDLSLSDEELDVILNGFENVVNKLLNYERNKI